MKLRDLTTRVGDKLDLPATTVAQVLDTALAILFDDLARTGRLEWRGFGTFVIRTYPPRKIHNPATRQTIELQARTSVTFKPSSSLRSRLTSTAGRRAKRVGSFTPQPRRSERIRKPK